MSADSHNSTADSQQVLRQIGLWLEELQSRDLVATLPAKELKGLLTRSHGQGLATPNDPLLIIMLCGPTAVGKSSLINALAGSEISSPGLAATTSAAVLYVHKDDDPARLFEYTEALGQLGRQAASLVRHRHDALLHKILVDTPDIDSFARTHAEVTKALAQCADVVLFVTSPMKYKNVHAVRWIAEHRQQRAIGFVLNKWDQAAIGVQYERRNLISQDFLEVLAGIGFSDPVVFRTSALVSVAALDPENDFLKLQNWLGDALDQEAATAIQERRNRVAWGQLSSSVTSILPEPLSDQPFVRRAKERFEETRAEAKRMARFGASKLNVLNLDNRSLPIETGFLSLWTRIAARKFGITWRLRKLLPWGSALDPIQERPSPAANNLVSETQIGDFAEPTKLLFANLVAELTRDAEVASVALGPVTKAWANEAKQLREQCKRLPTEVEEEIQIGQRSRSLQQYFGFGILYTVEACMALIFVVAIWRLGRGFIFGKYYHGPMLLDAFVLLVSLGCIGQIVSRFFFPPVQEHLREVVSQRASAVIDQVWNQCEAALNTQLAVIAQLNQMGRSLLASVDEIIRSLASKSTLSLPKVQRLFGEGVASEATFSPTQAIFGGASANERTKRQTPRFD